MHRLHGCLKECNQFLAGHALRSKTRFKSLDETALVAVACRHEHPNHVFSLRHGERCVNLCNVMSYA